MLLFIDPLTPFSQHTLQFNIKPKSSLFFASAGVPLHFHTRTVMQRLPQFLVDFVVNLAEVNHYFFFCLATKRTQLLYGFQEERAALSAGVKLSEEEEEGVELFCQCRGEVKWKHACGHVQNGPSHGA
jgi:hypothetical protein